MPLVLGQLNVVAGQVTTVTLHDADVAEPQVFPTQSNVALPVVGAVLSLTVREPPDEVLPTDAEQVLPPTVQLSVVPGHEDAPHVAFAGALQLPLLQVNVAAPVSGAVLSVTLRAVPSVADEVEVEQLLPPTVHESTEAGHEIPPPPPPPDTVQVEPLA
ncbi:hypothetical protein E4T66_18015 [Sinimarinibacterium sp. CAU 1509]|uniref:hypothetical protein n=1 Tax=Sinimarinibacterium sp. CAU 1509 TaxID=2562283 RepID=UPI0010AD197F|nr:hypothetical protein [Sinimarinibacterium sp. CAU 1509]TJY57302.1 hypothetical protein E4T66_18015 [Sinimarinibacterium sp. CAU 1509]